MCRRARHWLAGAAGFEPLHLRSEFAKTSHSQDSNLGISKLVLVHFIVAQRGWVVGRTPAPFFKSARTCNSRYASSGPGPELKSQFQDAKVRILVLWLGVSGELQSKMQRFESRRPSQPVRLQRVTNEGRSKTARYPRHYADMTRSPCAKFGHGIVISASCLRGPFLVSRFMKRPCPCAMIGRAFRSRA